LHWIDLARDQWRTLVNTVMNFQVSSHLGKFMSSCTTGGFSRRTQFRGVRRKQIFLCRFCRKCFSSSIYKVELDFFDVSLVARLSLLISEFNHTWEIFTKFSETSVRKISPFSLCRLYVRRRTNRVNFTSAEVKKSGAIHPLPHTPSWRSA
jgi:hypothetical protein